MVAACQPDHWPALYTREPPSKQHRRKRHPLLARAGEVRNECGRGGAGAQGPAPPQLKEEKFDDDDDAADDDDDAADDDDDDDDDDDANAASAPF